MLNIEYIPDDPGAAAALADDSLLKFTRFADLYTVYGFFGQENGGMVLRQLRPPPPQQRS